MKTKRSFIFLLLLFIQVSLFGQCPLDDFLADISGGTPESLALQKAIAGDKGLIDSWAGVKHVSETTRRNVSFLEKLNFLKEDNSKGLRDHIFTGDYKKVNGCHYYGAVDNVNVRFVDGVTPEANSLGVIKGDIEMRRPIYDRGEIVDYRWTKKNTGQDPQTFFPSNWSQDEILEQCASAISNNKKKLVPGKTRLWEGESDSGIFIRWYENADGSIPSIFPAF